MLINEEPSTIEKRGGSGCGPITSKPLNISWESGVILSFHSLVRLKFQLLENQQGLGWAPRASFAACRFI